MGMRERISFRSRKPNLLLGPNARVVTESEAGAATTIPDAHAYGEAFELRYNVADADMQFQAIFARVAAAAGAAHTGTLRGCEFDARNETNQNSGTIEGVFGSATVKGTGTADAVYGVDGNVAMDADTAHTITEMAALRGKVQVEDAATITKGYGCLIEHEAVTGAKLIRAAYGAKSGAAAAFSSLIDCRDATLEVINTNQVRLMSFKDAAGTEKMLVYDPDSATAVSVANHA